MLRYCQFVLWIILLFGMPVYAQNDSPEHIAQLLTSLSSPERKLRLQAEESLLRLGPKALPQLKRTDNLPVSARLAIQRIQAQIIETYRSELLEPSDVSYEQGLHLEHVISHIQTQTGNQISYHPKALGQRTIEQAAANIPFWEAVNNLSHELQIGWNWSTAGELVMSSQVVKIPGQSCTAKTARINAEVIRRRQNFQRPQLRNVQRINCRIDLEPRLHLFYAVVEDADFLISTNGTTAKPFNPTAKKEIVSTNGHSTEFTIDFIAGRSQMVNPATLSGQVSVMCAAEKIPCRFPLQHSPSERQSVGQSELFLELVNRAEKDEIVCTMHIALDLPDDVFTSHRAGLLHQSVWLETTTGKLRPKEIQVLSIAGKTQIVRYSFNATATSTGTLVYEVPHLISEQTIDFKISDLLIDP